MGNNVENNSAIPKSDNPKRLSDYPSGSHDSPSLEQLNNDAKLHKKQNIFREKIDNQEHEKADKDLIIEIENLDNKVVTKENISGFIHDKFNGDKQVFLTAKRYLYQQSIFGRLVNQKELINKIGDFTEKGTKISSADKIQSYTESIRQGKSQTEILQILISKFENEEAVSTWVENWRNFQKLHQYAENKLPVERQSIQRIISKADFASENAFENSLTEISKSLEISAQTKLEISQEFDRANVFSVNDMDNTLKEVKNHKQKIENAIDLKSSEKMLLNNEIERLESEINKLPIEDPKRRELEGKLEQKKEVLKQTVTEINRLEEGKPKDISFQLREGFFARLNTDGSRSIKINSMDFAMKLPSNFLPLTGTKNLRSINLAFPFIALQNKNIARFIFSPNLENNSIPNKQNRKMGHLILSYLGIDDTKILSEENIKLLNTDLARLTSIPGKNGQDCLIELGVYDVASQSLNKKRFAEVLKFIRKNHGVRKEFFWEKLETFK